ncbi:DVU_1551 family NTP transferase [Thermodesulfobacteriota bacterium]
MTMQPNRISAIILAAGYSCRMGAFKPLLEIGNIPVLERVIRLFRDAGIEDVVVVLGHRREEVAPLVEGLGGRGVRNDHYERGMFSSVQAGVRALSPDSEAFFVLPVDIPLVRPQTIRDLLEYPVEATDSIVYPVFSARRGHPPLISAGFGEEILAHSGEGGLKAVLRKHEGSAVHVGVADRHILCDMDTPADYTALQDGFGRYGVPTPDELKVLMETKFPLRGDRLRHSCAVARTALKLAGALNRARGSLDVGLVLSTAFLHNEADGEPNRVLAIAEELRKMGFSTMAEALVSRSDPFTDSRESVTETELVYLAERLVHENRLFSADGQFIVTSSPEEGDSTARETILTEDEHTSDMIKRVERELGGPLESALDPRTEATEDEAIQSLLAATW